MTGTPSLPATDDEDTTMVSESPTATPVDPGNSAEGAIEALATLARSSGLVLAASVLEAVRAGLGPGRPLDRTLETTGG